MKPLLSTLPLCLPGGEKSLQDVSPPSYPRRHFLSTSLAALGGLGWTGGRASPTEPSASVELLQDPGFRRGFLALEPAPGRRVVYAQLAGRVPGARPAWDLAQWSSRHRLSNHPVRRADDSVRHANTAKEVILGVAGTSHSDLTLAVNASAEYGSQARKQGEPWVHLLVEQPLERQTSLAELRELVLRLECKLLRSHLHRTADYTPDLHAAQFQLFLTVQNRNRESGGYGKFLWFGVPFYDDRYRHPPGHAAQDTAGSDSFIYTSSSAEFVEGSTHDGTWIPVQKDLAPVICEALSAAWQQGFLTESRELKDYRVTSINVGWEVPGILDVAMQVRELSLRAL